MAHKFKVGDKVVWADEFYRGRFFPDCPPDAILTVVGHDGDHGCECVLLKGSDQLDVEAKDESKGHAFLERAVENSKPLIEQKVEEIITQMDSSDITYKLEELMYRVVEDRLLGKKSD